MRFRSPTAEPIRVASTNGHVAIIKKEWRELPETLHEAAVKAGAQQEGQPKPPAKPKPAVASANASNQVANYDSAYREALTTMISRDVKGDFTKDSLPNIAAVSKLAGFAAVKEDVLRVFREMKAEADVDGVEAAG